MKNVPSVQQSINDFQVLLAYVAGTILFQQLDFGSENMGQHQKKFLFIWKIFGHHFIPFLLENITGTGLEEVKLVVSIHLIYKQASTCTIN